jgi:hypothetical protein
MQAPVRNSLLGAVSMTKRTRLFLLVAAGILVVGLGTGVLASYMGLQNLTLIGGDGPAEFAYVPADARFVGYANVRDVMDSDLRRKLTALDPDGDLQPGGDGANRFRERTGIDIEKDIDYVIAAASGSEGDSNGPPLVLARGRFDQVRLEGFALQEGATIEDYKGKRLATHDNFGLAFVEPGLVAVGNPAAVRRAIDTKAAGTAGIGDNQELMRLVREVDDGTVWGVARFDALANARLPKEVSSRLPAINWFSIKGVINGGVEGQVRAEARDDVAAQDLRQVIQGFMALARMQMGQHAELADLMNSLQLGGQGKTVSLTFSVPAAMIDVLGALRAQRRPELQPQPAPGAPSPNPEPRRRPAPPAL